MAFDTKSLLFSISNPDGLFHTDVRYQHCVRNKKRLEQAFSPEFVGELFRAKIAIGFIDTRNNPTISFQRVKESLKNVPGLKICETAAPFIAYVMSEETPDNPTAAKKLAEIKSGRYKFVKTGGVYHLKTRS